MDIEGFAIGAVLQRLAYTEGIQAFVNMRDKEPLWDGGIYVYKDSQKTKDDLNRIAIQVKGVLSQKRKGKNKGRNKAGIAPYSVEIKALEAYNRDGGVLFFVVDIPAIERFNGKVPIFYALLLPFDIRRYLDKAAGQDTVGIHLSPFPDATATSKIRHILTSAITDKQRQNGYINIPKEFLAEYQNRGKYPLTFDVSISRNSPNVLKEINAQNPYVYAKRTDGTLVPIDKGVNITSFETNTPKSVTVKGKVYYGEYKTKFKESGETTFSIGSGNQFVISPMPGDNSNTKVCNFSCNSVGTLNQQIRDTEFYCIALENLGFELDGQPYQFTASENSDRVLKNMRDKLCNIKRFRDALNRAGYALDLEIMEFDDRTWRLVDDFIAVFVDGKKLQFNNLPVGNYFCRITFGKTTLPLLVFKDEHGCNMYNPYSHPLPIYGEDNEGNQYSISQYVLFDELLLKTCTYIDFDTIWESLVEIKMSKTYKVYLTNLLLRILLACDKDAPLRKELLDFALKIAQWLCELSTDEDKDEIVISLLNLFQTKMRIPSMTDEDNRLLHSIPVNYQGLCDSNMVGYCILAHDFSNARKYYDLLKPDAQKTFLDFPIMHFWNDGTRPSAMAQEGETPVQTKEDEN